MNDNTLQPSPPPTSEQTAQKQHRQDKREEVKEELQEAIQESYEILVTATTVFPFTIFRDTLTIDRAKLTITQKAFFKMGEVMSIRMEDILNVTATVGPFLGSVKIVTRVLNNEKPFEVHNFWREDALRIKRIAQGYVIALQKEIDTTQLKTPELVAMLDELGKDDHN